MIFVNLRSRFDFAFREFRVVCGCGAPLAVGWVGDKYVSWRDLARLGELPVAQLSVWLGWGKQGCGEARAFQPRVQISSLRFAFPIKHHKRDFEDSHLSSRDRTDKVTRTLSPNIPNFCKLTGLLCSQLSQPCRHQTSKARW